MQRQLALTDTDTDRVIYAALIRALRFGRMLIQTAPGRDVIRRERDTLRALQTIGEPDPTQREDVTCPKCGAVAMQRDPKAYRLLPEGGTVVLDQAQIELLQERIDKGPWTGDGAIEMADALDRIGAAPEVPRPAAVEAEDMTA